MRPGPGNGPGRVLGTTLLEDLILEKDNLQFFIIITIIYLMHVWQVRIASLIYRRSRTARAREPRAFSLYPFDKSRIAL